MTSEQAFDILGIYDRNIDEASLKKAFYSAARRTHPDSNPDDENAKAKFHMINEAYDVLCEYLKYENKRKANATKENVNDRAQKSATYNRAGEEQKDVWEAYEEADRRYAKKRHSEARAKAEETIRNHAKHEDEKIKREKQAAKEQEEERKRAQEKEKREREEKIRREEEQLRKAKEQLRKEQEQLRKEKLKKIKSSLYENLLCIWNIGKSIGKRMTVVWNKYVAGNKKIRQIILIVLVAILLFWAGLEILGAIRGIVGFAQILAGIAKWILIFWMTYKITWTVHKNWNNRILSAFAFLISMELELVLMNGLEDLVRTLHL